MLPAGRPLHWLPVRPALPRQVGWASSDTDPNTPGPHTLSAVSYQHWPHLAQLWKAQGCPPLSIRTSASPGSRTLLTKNRPGRRGKRTGTKRPQEHWEGACPQGRPRSSAPSPRSRFTDSEACRPSQATLPRRATQRCHQQTSGGDSMTHMKGLAGWRFKLGSWSFWGKQLVS